MGWDAIRGYVVVLMDVRGTGFQVSVLFLSSTNNQHCYSYFFVYLIFSVPCIYSPPLQVHCTESPINVFPEIKLRGLVPNSYIHVSVRDLYIPRIGLPIWLQQNRQTHPWNI
jgi:hypothetical protein